MADDLTKRGPADRSRINVNEEHELDYWTGALGCTREKLRAAVAAVGPMADNVREFFRKNP